MFGGVLDLAQHEHGPAIAVSIEGCDGEIRRDPAASNRASFSEIAARNRFSRSSLSASAG
jgi:hypothetical protein